MKATFLFLIVILSYSTVKSQQIIEVNEDSIAFDFMTSQVLLHNFPDACGMFASGVVYKDTSLANNYILLFSYSTPSGATALSKNDRVLISFVDGTTFEYYNSRNGSEEDAKDTLQHFSIITGSKLIKKMRCVLVYEIKFITSSYNHTVEVSNEYKLWFSYVADLLIRTSNDYYDKIVASLSGIKDK